MSFRNAIVLLLISWTLNSCCSNESDNTLAVSSELAPPDSIPQPDTIVTVVQNGYYDWARLDTVPVLTVEECYKNLTTEYHNYAQIIDSTEIGVEDTIHANHSIHYRTYLGVLRDLITDEPYYVIRDFWTLELANGLKGHSELVFIRDSNDFVVKYGLEMPEELPLSIEDNTLIFKRDSTEFGWQLASGLSFIFCTPWNHCYGICNPSVDD